MSSSMAELAVLRPKSLSLTTKRLIDILGAVVGILVLLPTFIVVAILIKMEDGGPVFHRRRVLGKNGEFDLFKFRSMCVNADEVLQSNPDLLAEFRKNYKLVDDPRVTKSGRFLRKTSLDELPQLFNVIAGQMSLVGPRSITHEELDKYGQMRHLLLTVKPGMSGYWQTEGRQKVSYQERVNMDINYVQNWTLLWDLKILLKTPQVVFKGEGAH